MSLYDDDPGAKAPEPESVPEASGGGEIVVPDYEPASPAAAGASSAGVVGAPAGVGPLDKLNCMATVVPAPNAVNKVAAAELALLQTRMFNITWWCAQLRRSRCARRWRAALLLLLARGAHPPRALQGGDRRHPP